VEDDRSAEQAVQAEGIRTRHERMDNGEFRFRLLAGDGSAYIRTVAGPAGAWQNSHYHNEVRETYIVQRGWAALVELVDGAVVWHMLAPGDVCTTRPLVPHNLYLPAGAATHTVKHGRGQPDDWHPCPELDALVKPLSEDAVRAIRR
jgi:mannose-6-phosphate isomerase-like protein (cupin superfamily)